ncbi:metal-dependent transcriptional regulator [Zhihengliuella sp.]|uniref:metal-dependent transcriptional regulator n=1 Tax=Zhihengliuella sp. TaxID=1954483 RepID=UPI0028127F35|nr:metal-dependent transcriptional regulator [Zhihengliuella sp.]
MNPTPENPPPENPPPPAPGPETSAPGAEAPASPVPRLSPSEENYLKVVYALREWAPADVTTGRLATALGVAPASATAMVGKLVSRGFLDHPPYGSVNLTPEGLSAALSVVRRHRLIESFLVEHLGYSWDEVHDEAEVLEHTVSQRFVDRIDALLGHPTADPHGDPIPTSQGDPRRQEAERLDTVTDGEALVVRVSDSSPDILRACADAGAVPGATLDVAPARTVLPEAAVSSIWVRRLDA